MKVKDVMQSSVPFVEEGLQIKNLARLIYTTNTPGFPVVKDKKLIGFVTEEDLFSQLYSVEGEELRSAEHVSKIMESPVSKIMVRDIVSVTPETDLLDAQRLMYRYNFTRLPVAGKDNEFLGTITRSDVFGHILKNEIPKLEEGQYSSFVLENYDQMVDWEKRFDFEFPTLFRIFTKHKAKKILDLGIGTGEYSIRLAQEGIEEVIGVDENPLMIEFANSKRNKLSSELKERVSFQSSNYSKIDKQFADGTFDAVICMGGALPYFSVDTGDLIKQVHSMTKKDGVFVIQLLNLERVIEKRRRFLYFKINKAKDEKNKEEMYIEFFDVKDEKTLAHNVVHFTSEAGRWIYRGINSIEIKYVKNNDLEPLLKKAGFKDIIITGNKGEYKGAYGQISLVKPFDPETSEWMTIVATK